MLAIHVVDESCCFKPHPADIQERYNRIERQVAERSNTLQMTRMQCLSLQDSLHSLLIWLEEKENTFDKLERGTRMMIKRNALLEQLQQHKVRQSLDKYTHTYHAPGWLAGCHNAELGNLMSKLFYLLTL